MCCLPAPLASQESNQDPIDLAFLAAAKEHHVFDGLLRHPVSFAPFDAKSRRTEAVVEQNGQRLHVMKAPCAPSPRLADSSLAIEALDARVSAAAGRLSDSGCGTRTRETHRPGRTGVVV